MNKELIDRLAREAGFRTFTEPGPGTSRSVKGTDEDLQRFAALVARECARLADSSGMQMAIMELFKA